MTNKKPNYFYYASFGDFNFTGEVDTFELDSSGNRMKIIATDGEVINLPQQAVLFSSEPFENTPPSDLFKSI